MEDLKNKTLSLSRRIESIGKSVNQALLFFFENRIAEQSLKLYRLLTEMLKTHYFHLSIKHWLNSACYILRVGKFYSGTKTTCINYS